MPALRLLEGYWTRPSWLYGLLTGYRRWRHRRVSARAKPLQERQRRGKLTVKEYAELRRLRKDHNPEDAERLAALEWGAAAGLTAAETVRLGRDVAWLRTTPDRNDFGMPTRLGDILRTVERRPTASYGLDAVVCWGALNQLLPVELRTELTAARTALDAAARGWLWGALFLLWSPLSWWALVVGIGVPLLSYRFGILPRAVIFGELVVNAYDLHRVKLYTALHLPRPISPHDERVTAGPRVTKALTGPLVDDALTYQYEPASTTTPAPDAERGSLR